MIRKLLLLLFFVLPFISFSQSYNASFAKNVIFTEPFGVSHTNYYLYLEMNTATLVSSGKMQADGDDIRFVADCGQNQYYDYYIHRGMNTSKTEIYVRVPSVSANQTDTIQVLYGDNAAAGASNFSATFPNAIRTGGTSVTRGGVVEAGWVEVGSGDKINITSNTVLELRAAYMKIDGQIDGVGDGFQAPSSTFQNGTGTGGGRKTPGNNSGSGAGAYGGNGGRGGFDSQTGDPPGQGGSSYGSATSMAIQKGSSGASGASGSSPGDGGGAVILRTAKLQLNGTINVNAGNTSGSAGQCSGGGAGGGVLIVADSINVGGSASITARGSNGSSGASANDGGGGGGGGRVKIFRDTYLSGNPSMNVSGGSGGCCGNGGSGAAGGAGSTHVTTTNLDSVSIGSELSATPFSIQATLDTVCPGVSSVLSVTNPGSITWSNGASTNSITVTPGATATYYVFGTSTSGCVTSDTFELVVDAPDVDLGPDTNNCGPKTIDAGSETGTQYVWTTGDSTSTITVSQTQTMVVTASRGGCNVKDTLTLTIDSIPIVTLSLPDDSICKLDSVVLTGVPAGGTMTGQGLNGLTFNSQNLGAPAVYTQVYEFVDANGCFERDTTNIFVQAIPIVTLTSLSNFSTCIGDSAILNGTPLGGTYTGTGVNDTLFNSNVSGIGGFTINYSFTDSIGCTASASDSMVVHALPTPQLSFGDTTLCLGDNTVLNGTPAGGQFRGTGVLFNGFDSQTAGVGTHELRYYFRDRYGCFYEDTLPIVVNALPVVDFTFGSDTICEGTSTVLTPNPAGGTFSGSSGLSGNIFNGTGIGLGFRNITYNYTDQNGCSNSEMKRILIIGAPRNVEITSSVDSLCIGDDAVLTASPSGGAYSGAGVNDTLFSSQGLTIGSTVAYYTYSNSAGCSTMDSTVIWINPLPIVSVSTSGSNMCLGDSVSIQPSPLGGALSGIGVVDTMFYSDSSGTGMWTITYDYVDSNGCAGQASAQVTVNSCAGVEENAETLFSVFPNPANGLFYFTSYVNDATAAIVDAQGRLIKELRVNNTSSQQIDISEYSKGIYYLVMNTEQGSQQTKLVVQ